MEKGDLDKRCEYNSNEICRLAPVSSHREIEKEGKSIMARNGEMEGRYRDFVNVMSAVLNNKSPNTVPATNQKISSFRIKERKRPIAMSGADGSPKAKLKRLSSYQTSTPMNRREPQPVIFSDQDTSVSNSSLTFSDWSASATNRSPTKVSLDMQRNQLTPPKPESKSLEIRKVLTTTLNWDNAAKTYGLIRSRSLPVINDLKENAFFIKFPSRRSRERSYSMSDIDALDLESCSWSIEKEGNQSMVSTVREESKQVPSTSGGLNGLCENSYMTPKRKLDMSPETPMGLQGKLERFTVDQTASPTLRKLVNFKNVTTGRMEHMPLQEQTVTVNNLEPDQETSFRRFVLGRRRILDHGAELEMTDKVPKSEDKMKEKPKQNSSRPSLKTKKKYGRGKKKNTRVSQRDNNQPRIVDILPKQCGSGPCDFSSSVETEQDLAPSGTL